MELRLLKSFLVVAQEESVSKAAKVLHITQPTLSRQLQALEEELGTPLFERKNRSMQLTPGGILLKDRAQEILQLVKHTETEFENQEKQLLRGHISFGCIEGTGSNIFSELVQAFHTEFPNVTYSIFTGTGDDISDRIVKGIVELGVLIEPINLTKYNTLNFDNPEPWGLLVHKNNPLAEKTTIQPEDLENQSLFISVRAPVIKQLSNWYGNDIQSLNIIGHYNLLSNVALLVEKEVGAAISTRGAAIQQISKGTKFIPLDPSFTSSSHLVWKKQRILSPTVEQFIKHSHRFLKIRSDASKRD
ncbi:LysR family transcriptional regulator [Desemzia sp. RIT804]|uniref:LysR family transcriptional regulator n=1 Tax=Desemzia sp. RIT 804 TaxID=2810209 RepID=UPI0019522A89|nr:LysR family transcriptional regulator [Desemzia sp. RIT 804]MBM6614872.1 LysR family transcriptional regulator [Desemzia sp. RIT 804]